MTKRLHLDGAESSPHRIFSWCRWSIPCALLIALTTPAPALPPTPQPVTLKLSEYQKQDWQVEDGLPGNNVRMVGQRPGGLLILATSAGLSTFDGERFHSAPIGPAGLIDNEAVNAILPDGDNLWIGTDGRGILYQTPAGTTEISEAAGFHNERVRMLYKDAAGVLWIATQNGIERIVHHHLERLAGTGMISGDITSPFAEDGAGGMFFITSEGLFHWTHNTVSPYPLGGSPTEKAVAVYRDPQQRLWVGTMAHLIELLPQPCALCTSPKFKPVQRATLDSPITVLLGDSSHNLWMGTRHAGVWRFGQDGLTHWSTKNGLPDDAIRTLFIDDEQNLWIGMLAGGLSRWHKGALAPFDEPEALQGTYAANTLVDSHGDLWLSTWGKGLFRRHNGRLLPASPPGMPLATPIRALAEDSHRQLWVGTWFDGVYRYDGQAFHHYLLGNESPGNAVSSILPDRRGGLWIGTYTGVFYFAGGTPDPQHRAHFLESQLITCMTEDRDGSILVGTSTGLYRIQDGVVTAISGLPHPYVLSLVLDSGGYLWVGTKAGALSLVRHDHVTLLPPNANVPNLLVNTATEDKDGHLWLGTFRGIVRISVAELHAVIDGRQSELSASILGRADGMRSSECNGPSQPSSAKMPDGTLWFATTKGFVHTTDVAERLDVIHPTAALTGWSLSSDPDAPVKTETQRIDLDAGQPDIILAFNAKLLSNPAQVEYRYRLVNYDPDWTITRAHAAHYRRLPAGRYKFEVQARASGEEWTSPIVSVDVRQHTYLYQTWYFYLTVILLGCLIAIALFRHRVRLMKGRIGIVLEERNRISRECHDTLMAGFAAISWQLEATTRLFRDGDSSMAPAAKSCELARSMVSHCQAEARRIIWDLRDMDEVTNVLSLALERSLTANPQHQAVETTFRVEGNELPLAPGNVHHLVCIAQEAVTNAVRHADPAQLLVLLKYEPDSLTLSIHDDGRGFVGLDIDAARHGHFGIPVMEERARKLGGTLRLQTSAEAGTEVTVRVPFSAMTTPQHQEHHVIRWIGV